MTKRYSLSCVGQGVLNLDFEGYHNFRIEVFDNEANSNYAVMEGSCMGPPALLDALYDVLEWKDFDLPIKIDLDMTTIESMKDAVKRVRRNSDGVDQV